MFPHMFPKNFLHFPSRPEGNFWCKMVNFLLPASCFELYLLAQTLENNFLNLSMPESRRPIFPSQLDNTGMSQ